MTDAPERIHLDGDSEAGEGMFPRCFENPKYCSEPAIEYIRADLVEELQTENQRLREEKEAAEDTLTAWFDRRKLAHEAIDQAVIDAVGRYLRTSRVGGMPQTESDLVLEVISDMARLSLFADLFVRAALLNDGGRDE